MKRMEKVEESEEKGKAYKKQKKKQRVERKWQMIETKKKIIKLYNKKSIERWEENAKNKIKTRKKN